MSVIHPPRDPSSSTAELAPPAAAPLTIAFAFITGKTLSNTSKIELFNGDNFKHWQEKVFDILDVHILANYLQSWPLEVGIEDYDKKL